MLLSSLMVVVVASPVCLGLQQGPSVWRRGGVSRLAMASAAVSTEEEAAPLAASRSSGGGGPFTKEPLLVRAARGEAVATTPVWMMRQAGRHMQAYRDLVAKYPTFRDRSETPEASLEISLQPFEAYGVDGCIMFSDILTPLPAMGVDFSISEKGEIRMKTVETFADLEALEAKGFDATTACPFVGETLRNLRAEIARAEPVDGAPAAAVLGFVGLPFTLATYVVEGKTGTASGFAKVKAMREDEPALLHAILAMLARNIADYACYQIDSGAQVVQVFDSWAGHLDDDAFEAFAATYQRQVIATIKERHPETPVIIYMAPDAFSKNGGRLPQLAASGADVVSVDHTVDFQRARDLIPDHIGIQGNLDPAILRDGPLDLIKSKTEDILKIAKGKHHIMNLGHGIEATTPETHADFFVKTVHSFVHVH